MLLQNRNVYILFIRCMKLGIYNKMPVRQLNNYYMKSCAARGKMTSKENLTSQDHFKKCLVKVEVIMQNFIITQQGCL